MVNQGWCPGLFHTPDALDFITDVAFGKLVKVHKTNRGTVTLGCSKYTTAFTDCQSGSPEEVTWWT